jgi:hypothetical protein
MRKTTALLFAACFSVFALLSASPASAESTPAGTDGIAAVAGVRSLTASPQAGPYHMWFSHSAKCIAIPNNTTANVQLHQWSCFNTNSELWHLDYVFTDANGFDFWRIRSAHSGKCLNISGDSLQNGAPVVQYPCGSYANEYFVFWADSNVPSGFWWVQAYSSGKVLNIAGNSRADGAKLIQYTRCYCSNEYIATY